MVIDMTDTTTSDHLPREELWAGIKEAHYYLHQWVNDLSSREHPAVGEVEFNAYNWGLRYPRGCEVCLAGLWYLHKVGRLLEVEINDDDEYVNLPPLCRFLDKLRYPEDNADEIEEWLGIAITYGTLYLDQERGGNYEEWDSGNPEHILHFLGWLLNAGRVQEVYAPTV